jgi:hypothetical protein
MLWDLEAGSRKPSGKGEVKPKGRRISSQQQSSSDQEAHSSLHHRALSDTLNLERGWTGGSGGKSRLDELADGQKCHGSLVRKQSYLSKCVSPF